MDEAVQVFNRVFLAYCPKLARQGRLNEIERAIYPRGGKYISICYHIERDRELRQYTIGEYETRYEAIREGDAFMDKLKESSWESP